MNFWHPFFALIAPRMPALLRLLFLLGVLALPATAAPVEFRFIPPAAPAVKNPFARELWAEVTTPSGRTLALPAFYLGDRTFAVRARPDEAGTYRLGAIAETTGGRRQDGLAVQPASPRQIDVTPAARTRLPAISRDPADAHGFQRSDGRRYFPVGANLAWPEGDCVPYYRGALAAFAKNDLNWMRVWMVHWGGLNLDWSPETAASPRPGGLDPAVAQRWDDLLAAAEENGVYLQVVFQHHGQFTTGANSNWIYNPWNAAHPGGFLKSPEDFFTDPNARLITALKYRYIVARWGWSSAVFAWEFFNEVHWTDAWAHGREADVARWHGEMADLVRSVDAYRHMVTTSTDYLRSATYAKMDFYQPHLYAANLVAGARSFDPAAATLDRPVFYGEVGHDHLPATGEAKEAGLTLVPPAWAALMGQGTIPAQPWEGAKLLARGLAGELGAVHRFAVRSGLLKHRAAQPFSAVVACDARVPLRIAAGQIWQRRAGPELTIPTDGREEPGFADIPGVLVGSKGSLDDGFPGRAIYHFDLPRATTLRAQVKAIGAGGSALRLSLDGRPVVEKSWPAGATGLPAEFSFEAVAGKHTLVVENPGGPDWIEMPAIDLGLDIPALAAIGRRDEGFLALWLWRRDALYAVENPAPIAGTLVLEDVAAGTWSITWWDTKVGQAGESTTVQHGGGALRVPTPSVARHTAVVLVRQP